VGDEDNHQCYDHLTRAIELAVKRPEKVPDMMLAGLYQSRALTSIRLAATRGEGRRPQDLDGASKNYSNALRDLGLTRPLWRNLDGDMKHRVEYTTARAEYEWAGAAQGSGDVSEAVKHGLSAERSIRGALKLNPGDNGTKELARKIEQLLASEIARVTSTIVTSVY
jgi:hypothetical protein